MPPWKQVLSVVRTNPGSTLSGLDSNIARIAANTNISAAMGGTVAALYTMAKWGKADPSMAINGALGGLVAITASCAYVEPISALVIGGIAGMLVVFAVPLFDAMRADDPVGAIAVHGVCGTFGTIAVGIFAEKGGLLYGGGLHLVEIQTLGVVAVSLWGFGMTYGLFTLLKAVCGIRVTVEEEIEGLDISEHGMTAYNDLECNPLKTLSHMPPSSVVYTAEESLAEQNI